MIFISYSHDSKEHRQLVLQLSERLRGDGLKTELDQYINGDPIQGWPRWMLDKLDEASHVLVICTETYYRRFRGHEEPHKGKGVDWEGALITQECYEAHSKTCKFVPVLFDINQHKYIPEPLRSRSSYLIDSEQNYLALYNFLTGQAGVEPGEIGPLILKSKKPIDPLTFKTNSNYGSQHESSERSKHNILTNKYNENDGKYSATFSKNQNLNYHSKFDQKDSLNDCVAKLAKFICRPESAYCHILDEFRTNKRLINACLCLFSSDEICFPDFGKTIRDRIKAGFIESVDIELIEKLDNSNCSRLRPNPWNYKTREDFVSDCKNELRNILSRKRNCINNYPQNSEVTTDFAIFTTLMNATEPYVFLSDDTTIDTSLTAKLLDISGKKIINRIALCYEWINRLSDELNLSAHGQPLNHLCPPMLILFGLRVEKSIIRKVNSCCFTLNEIGKNEFRDWRYKIVNIYQQGDFDDVLDRFEKNYFNSGSTLTYVQFINLIKIELKKVNAA
jgi:hypothetical protein